MGRFGANYAAYTLEITPIFLSLLLPPRFLLLRFSLFYFPLFTFMVRNAQACVRPLRSG